MTKDELRILARTECLILWDELARTGSRSKLDTIRALHRIGRLSLDRYGCDCPLCEFLREDGKLSCENCIWPGDKRKTARCIRYNSPFYEWSRHRTPASAVFDIIWNTDI